MKKLLFAIAGAAVFSAFAADPSAGANDIDVLGFENFDLTDTANVSGAVVERDDTGVTGTSKWSCSGDDASTVKAYGGDNATAPNITEPDLFVSRENTQYLALDTNGSELKREIPAAKQAVAATGTYIDTLVQFTPSESAPSADDISGAKLAIWLGVENNVTNLCVVGGYYYDDNGEPQAGSNKVYRLSGTYEPSTWYRLTVEARDISTDQGTVSLLGFVIRIDGNVVAASEGVYDSSLSSVFSAVTVAADKTLLDENKFIPTMGQDFSTAPTLISVGFKGTGALDDFVVTTEEPGFAPAAISLTLTWTAAEVDAVAYVLDSDPATTNVLSNGTAASIPASAIGTNATLVVTFASGYEFDYLAIGDYHHPYLTFPVPAVSTNATLVAKATPAGWVDDPTTVASETAAVAYPALAGTALATANAGQLTTWAKANSVSFTDATTDPDDYVEAFLLNCAVADVDTEKEEFKATITVGADGTITVTTPDGKDYNGTLKLKGKANLSDAEWADVPNNTPTSSYHFYMYELSL